LFLLCKQDRFFIIIMLKNWFVVGVFYCQLIHSNVKSLLKLNIIYSDEVVLKSKPVDWVVLSLIPPILDCRTSVIYNLKYKLE
jgi:hypothetical protein